MTDSSPSSAIVITSNHHGQSERQPRDRYPPVGVQELESEQHQCAAGKRLSRRPDPDRGGLKRAAKPFPACGGRWLMAGRGGLAQRRVQVRRDGSRVGTA
ncbi:hypothetical protein JHW43_003685 [Diplocarpon mali]|nr:hypothetical protein JHW43_003685 [Diplocarpon mali]